jgi:hypothetical protein
VKECKKPSLGIYFISLDNKEIYFMFKTLYINSFNLHILFIS